VIGKCGPGNPALRRAVGVSASAHCFLPPQRAKSSVSEWSSRMLGHFSTFAAVVRARPMQYSARSVLNKSWLP
jgi:hypothetical protein